MRRRYRGRVMLRFWKKRILLLGWGGICCAGAVHLSAADKKAIKEIFKGVDSSKYRLQFNGGKEVVGSKRVSMRQLEQVRKITNPGEAAGWVVLIVSDDGIVYIVAASHGQTELEGLLGKEKTARLNQIAAKYTR